MLQLEHDSNYLLDLNLFTWGRSNQLYADRPTVGSLVFQGHPVLCFLLGNLYHKTLKLHYE